MSMCRLPVHVRREHAVRGHFRNYRSGRRWVSEHMRRRTIVNDHCSID